MGNPLTALQDHGQSVWLDYIRRSLMTSGELARLIAEDGLHGVTSNPAIFEKAITGSTDYEQDLTALLARPELDAKAIYETLAIGDIRAAADGFRPVYDATRGADGYVSLEVSPDLAHDTARTLAEARRLWAAVGRDNLMIKVPGTPAGVPAIRQLIAEGINVNVTLLFAQSAYEAVAEAYLAGLEARAAAGGDVARVASVASFFVSRIDALVDGLLAERLKAATDPAVQAALRGLQGRIAIANARLAYQHYRTLVRSPRWQALAARGARPQRLLWASTSTKNPAYRDVLYVEELIGPDTVNTLPPATFDAFRDHGEVRPSLGERLDEARETMAALERAGISMTAVTDRLLDEGVRLFEEAFTKLLGAVAKRRAAASPAPAASRQSWTLSADLDAAVRATLADWERGGKIRRLWARDATVWTGTDEAKWLGWLGIVDDQLAHVDHLRRVQEEIRGEGFTHAVLLGMGGSSLCPEVLSLTFGRIAGFPELLVLDSTDPAQVRGVESRIDLARTLFIVSSKSGSTLEPNVFMQYFLDRVRQTVGAEQAGRRFVAITDPGSKLERDAKASGFRHVFHGVPSIGGRYSALSDFGMVPAAVMGLDVARLLGRAEEMAHACAASVPLAENPGARLGVVLGVLGSRGRDKVTLVASPGLHDLGAWLEQLLAESTGKQGKGLIPVDREPLGPPEVYGDDRLFAYLRLASAPDAAQDGAIAALEAAGHPVVRIAVPDPYGLAEEFFRWEFATAVAGAILGINPFDQPDVEASKVATRRLTDEYERTGRLPAEAPFLETEGTALFTDAGHAVALRDAGPMLAGVLRGHFGRLAAGDYAALLAYVEMTPAHEAELQAIRTLLRDRRRVATCVGFGPRFLHSTGQAYKGGPNSGVFLQITADDARDVPVPGQRYTFGVIKAAQARGDFEVLAERGRRVLRIHLGPDVAAGLARLRRAVGHALA